MPTRRAAAASCSASTPMCRCRSTSTRSDTAGRRSRRCYELFSELGFRSLVMEYAPTADTIHADYRLVDDGASSTSSLASCERRGRFALRVLPTVRRVRAGIVGPGVFDAAPGRRVCAAPASRHAQRSAADRRARRSRALKPLLEDASIEKIGHDLKFDCLVLARHGVTLAGLGLDTMLASYLLDATRSGHPLETAALEYLGYKALTKKTSAAEAPRRSRWTIRRRRRR